MTSPGCAGWRSRPASAAATWATTSSCRSGRRRRRPGHWCSSTPPPRGSASPALDGVLPVELGGEPAGDRDDRGPHRHGRGAGAASPAAGAARARRRRAAGGAGSAAARLRGPAGGAGPAHRSPDAALRRFYYDTVTHDHDLLADLVRYAGAGQVLLGSDRPFDMGTDDPVAEVRALGLGAGEDLVLGGTAARLLGDRPGWLTGMPGHGGRCSPRCSPSTACGTCSACPAARRSPSTTRSSTGSPACGTCWSGRAVGRLRRRRLCQGHRPGWGLRRDGGAGRGEAAVRPRRGARRLGAGGRTGQRPARAAGPAPLPQRGLPGAGPGGAARPGHQMAGHRAGRGHHARPWSGRRSGRPPPAGPARSRCSCPQDVLDGPAADRRAAGGQSQRFGRLPGVPARAQTRLTCGRRGGLLRRRGAAVHPGRRRGAALGRGPGADRAGRTACRPRSAPR